MFLFHLIVSLCVVAYCNQEGEWLNCKPKPGCSIARCDPRPAGRWFENDDLDNDFPILCQQNKAPSSATTDTEVTLLERDNAEIESGLRDELDRVKEEVKEGKTKLNGAMKQIEFLNEEVERMNKENKAKMDEAMKRIAFLEKKHAGTESSTDMVKEKLNMSTGKIVCPVKYDNKCFLAVTKGYVDYGGGVTTCKSHGGHLANIYSQTHMDDVMKYIKENRMAGSDTPNFRLGMKYDPKANKLTLRDGTDAPAGLKWYPGAPYNVVGWTNVLLLVGSDQSSIAQYLLNTTPLTRYYVLCEIE